MATTRELAIPIPHEAIAAFCRKWGVRRLSFFGSVVRDDFDPERSDVDVLVELRPDTKARGFAFFGAEIELSEIFDGSKGRDDDWSSRGLPDVERARYDRRIHRGELEYRRDDR